MILGALVGSVPIMWIGGDVRVLTFASPVCKLADKAPPSPPVGGADPSLDTHPPDRFSPITMKLHKPLCPKHEVAWYCEPFDAFYCAICRTWLERPCGDPACQYCDGRPEQAPPE